MLFPVHKTAEAYVEKDGDRLKESFASAYLTDIGTEVSIALNVS